MFPSSHGTVAVLRYSLIVIESNINARQGDQIGHVKRHFVSGVQQLQVAGLGVLALQARPAQKPTSEVVGGFFRDG